VPPHAGDGATVDRSPLALPLFPKPKQDTQALPTVLEAISAQVKDSNMVQALYGAVGGLLSNLDLSSKELEKLREHNAALEKAKNENENSTRNMSKQITRVLDSLYRAHANSAFDNDRAAVLEEVGGSAPSDPRWGCAPNPPLLLVFEGEWEGRWRIFLESHMRRIAASQAGV